MTIEDRKLLLLVLMLLVANCCGLGCRTDALVRPTIMMNRGGTDPPHRSNVR